MVPLRRRRQCGCAILVRQGFRAEPCCEECICRERRRSMAAARALQGQRPFLHATGAALLAGVGSACRTKEPICAGFPGGLSGRVSDLGGEVKPPSQHVQNGGVDEAEEVEIRSIAEAQSAVVRKAARAASLRAMAVLEGDLTRTHQRGRSRDCRCGPGRRNSLIPTMRRYASFQPSPLRRCAHWAIPVLRRV